MSPHPALAAAHQDPPQGPWHSLGTTPGSSAATWQGGESIQSSYYLHVTDGYRNSHFVSCCSVLHCTRSKI